MARSKQAKLIQKEPFDLEASVERKPDESNIRKIRIMEVTKELVSPVQRVTGSVFCHKNYTIHAFKEAFPHNVTRWVVGEYYPNAQGGGMFFDYPKTPHEEIDCQTKKAIMKKIGFRYAAITSNMDDQAIAKALES